MDVRSSRLGSFFVAAALATFSSLAFAADAPAEETPLQLQQRRVDALRDVAAAASPTNVPAREELVKGMVVVIAVADPALLPPASSGLAALGDLRTLCANGEQALVHLVQMARAVGDTAATLSKMSLAVDRTMIMAAACSARQLNIQAKAALAQPDQRPTADELAAMKKEAASLPEVMSRIVLGATLTDLNPNSRVRTAADALPILREAIAALPPAGKAATIEAVEKLLAPPDKDGHIDRAARDPLLKVLRGSECTASCKLLGES